MGITLASSAECCRTAAQSGVTLAGDDVVGVVRRIEQRPLFGGCAAQPGSARDVKIAHSWLLS
jgi:hypothetical protein